MSRKSSKDVGMAALAGDVASGTASGERTKREQALERRLTSLLRDEMTRRDRDGKVWKDGEVDPFASAMYSAGAAQGWKIYPDGLYCPQCRRPFSAEETEEAARAANSRRKAISDIFLSVAAYAHCNASAVIDASENMLAVLESACEIFEIWSAEGEGLSQPEYEMHVRLYEAAAKGRAALYPEPEDEEH